MRKQTGFTLVEVMVSVVILAIGLLGLAGLQATSTRFNGSAYLRSQATNLAYDIADRMRANVIAARGTLTNVLPLNAGAYDAVAIQNPPPACAAIVPAGTLAQQDIQAWQNALACTLPFGTGSITRNGLIFTIVVQWDDSRGQDPAQTFQMMTQL